MSVIKQAIIFFSYTFHALLLIAWLADGDSLMCYIVMMGRQIAKTSRLLTAYIDTLRQYCLTDIVSILTHDIVARMPNFHACPPKCKRLAAGWSKMFSTFSL